MVPLRWQTQVMAPSPESPETPSDDDFREKYKAALEAKKNKSGHGSAAPTSTGSSGSGQANRSGGKREFRRKSGG